MSQKNGKKQEKKEKSCWEFLRLISDSPMSSLIDAIYLDDDELRIFCFLAEHGPSTIYGLSTLKRYSVRMKRPRKLFKEFRSIGTIKEPKMGKRYCYDKAFKIVKKLVQIGLSKKTMQTGKPRDLKIQITFLGLLLYLRSSTNMKKFRLAVQHNEQLFPFLNDLKLLTNELSWERVTNTLNRALKEFVSLKRAMIRVRPLNLGFEGLLEEPFGSRNLVIILTGKRRKLSDFLRRQEAYEFRSSYLAYLAVHDIPRLIGKTRDQIEQLLPQLNSEKELAYFEERDVSVNPLFRGDRLTEFFPEYASLEHFLTGKLIVNLLWRQRKVENIQEEYDYDLSVWQ
jgi:hypothetical protein